MRRSPRGTCRGRPQLLALVTGLVLVLAACSSGEEPRAGAGGQTGTATPTGTASPTGPATPTSTSTPTGRASGGRPLLAVPAVTPPGFTTPPQGAGLGRYEGQKLAWTPCREGLQCATALVPLDYEQPDGTAVTLALAKRPATAAKRPGTLFINPGGPGGSGVDYVGFFRNQGLEGYDVVGWDPRGVGGSTPVSCAGADLDSYVSMDISPDNATEQRQLLEADRQLGVKCLQQSGQLLEHISTVEVARDLDLLRSLVGDPSLNFFGASYGTLIGATYAQLFPGRVGRMVLDGAVNITDDTTIGQAQGFERALDAFADWCASKRCKLGTTKAQVLESVAAFWQHTDGTPMLVGGRQLTQQLAVGGVIAALYNDASVYPALLRALQDAIVSGNGTLLLRWADLLNDRNAQGGYGQINYAFPAIRCLDSQDQGVQGAIDLANQASKTAPILGPFIGPDEQCPMWPVPALPKLKLVAKGAAPIVVIGTTGDPATPYEQAVSMAEQLESGVLLTFKGVGHTAYDKSPCVQRQVDAYLVQGVVPKDGTTC